MTKILSVTSFLHSIAFQTAVEGFPSCSVSLLPNLNLHKLNIYLNILLNAIMENGPFPFLPLEIGRHILFTVGQFPSNGSICHM